MIQTINDGLSTHSLKQLMVGLWHAVQLQNESSTTFNYYLLLQVVLSFPTVQLRTYVVFKYFYGNLNGNAAPVHVASVSSLYSVFMRPWSFEYQFLNVSHLISTNRIWITLETGNQQKQHQDHVKNLFGINSKLH